MAKQKITLQEGVVTVGRMNLFTPHGAKRTPAIHLSRLQRLLKTREPHICVVRGEGIGDVLMTTPTIHALKTMFEKVTLTVATNTSYLDRALVKVLKHNPDINHILERGLLDDSAYDLIVNLHCPAIAFEKKGSLPPCRIDLFARHAGVHLDNPVPRYFIQKEEIERGEILLQRISGRDQLIMVQPFASAKQRCSNHSNVKEAVIRLHQNHGMRSVIITHDGDPMTNVLWNNLPGSLLLHNEDIRGIAGIMIHCDLVICPDSSILHLAAALGTPTVGLFGPTHGPSRIVHYKNAVSIWEGEDIPACPCWYDNCPTGYACIDRITSQDIVEKCLKHLQNTSKVNIIETLNRAKPMTIETEIV